MTPSGAVLSSFSVIFIGLFAASMLAGFLGLIITVRRERAGFEVMTLLLLDSESDVLEASRFFRPLGI